MAIKHNPEPWHILDYYRGKIFDGQWPSLPQLFDITTLRFPTKKCFECFYPEHQAFTYEEASAIMDRIASYLVSIGIKKGDRVGLTGKNSPEWALVYLGVQRMGAIIVPVDYSLKDEEIEHFFDFVEVKGVFVEGERFERIGKDGKYGFKLSLSKHDCSEENYVLNIPDSKVNYSLPSENDSAAFLFTSGTTGVPKVVELTHKNLVADCFQAQSLMNISEKDVFYAILPIHHAYTMLAVFIESISAGSNLIFGKKLIVNQIFKEMREGKVTMFLAVPMLYNKIFSGIMKGVNEKGKFVSVLINGMMGFSGFMRRVFKVNLGKKLFGFLLKKVSLDNIRICISGGGPLPVETSKGFNKLGIDFVQGYGLTETSPILTLDPVFDYEPKSIGKPIAFVEMMFADKDEQGNGEICVKGPNVMKGYYNNPEATSQIIDSEGWLHTGDIGYMDNRGFVYLTGRAKNIIVSEGGKNIFPEEIEDHFQLFFDIQQICVLGFVADKVKKSEAVAAVIYPSIECRKKIAPEDMQRHMEEIVETVNKDLLPYKRIRKVIIADSEMEESSTKKIKRFTVAKKYAEQLEN